MIHEGHYQITASRQEVWDSLNDVRVLQACIPGCESLEATSDDIFIASVKIKIGPVNGKFKSEIKLEDINVPESYTLVIKTNGGAASMGTGLARVGPAGCC